MNNGGQFTNITGTSYDVVITDTAITNTTGTSFDYTMAGSGFDLKYQGSDEVYDALKGSSVKAFFYVDDSAEEDSLLTPFTTPNTNYYMYIFDGESSIYWYGFVTSKISSIENQDYPKLITIEAVDRITLSKEVSVWGNSLTVWGGIGSTFPHGNSTPPAPIGQKPVFRFGHPYSGVGAQLPHKPEPYITELVFSLLFDLDRDSKTDLFMVEHYDFSQSSFSRLSGGFGGTKASIDAYLYADYPSNKELNTVTAYDMLAHITEVFNARILQWRGVYYFIQNEIYQHANTVDYNSYELGLSNADQPVDLSNGTWGTSDYKYTISTSAKPRFLDGSEFQHEQALIKAQLNIKKGQPGNVLTNTVKTTVSNAPITNMHKMSAPIENIPLKGKMAYFEDGLVVHRGAWIKWVFREDGDGVTQSDSFMNHCLMGRYEAASDINKIIEGGFVDNGNYSPLKAITYDSSDWLWSDITYNAEMDDWQGRFVEMNADTTNSSGYSEITETDE